MQTLPSLDQFNFHHTLEDRKGLSVVFFTSVSCASCGYWKLLLGQYRTRRPEVEIYEIDAKRDQALAEEFCIFHLPALFLYANGAYQSELQCEANLEKLDAAIDEAMSQPPKELP